MAHESFEDDEIADILNKRYIPIKVDREERPDIDMIYVNVFGCYRQCRVAVNRHLHRKEGLFLGTYFPPRRKRMPGLEPYNNL